MEHVKSSNILAEFPLRLGCSHPWNRAHKTALQVLIDTRNLLADERRWTQGHFYRLALGQPIRFCPVGALSMNSGRDARQNIAALAILIMVTPKNKHSDHKRVTKWNDVPERTHGEVLTLLDAAIAVAQDL